MTITQTTHPDADCVLLNAFIPLWHKSNTKHNDFNKQNSKHTS